jgi:hypothetical protein
MQQTKTGRHGQGDWRIKLSARPRRSVQNVQLDALDSAKAGSQRLELTRSAHGYERMRQRQRESAGM